MNQSQRSYASQIFWKRDCSAEAELIVKSSWMKLRYDEGWLPSLNEMARNLQDKLQIKKLTIKRSARPSLGRKKKRRREYLQSKSHDNGTIQQKSLQT